MKTTNRVLSLDVFRGLTVAGMIMVNNPGSWSHIYAPLKHASWHGCTPTDLVFPFFLFIVGVSVSFSMSGVKDRKEQHPIVLRKVIWRSFKLVAIGLLLGLSSFVFKALFTLLQGDLPTLEGLASFRVPGVLQRIGIVFFIVAFLFLKTSWRAQLNALLVILVTYWAVMTLIPVPGVDQIDLSDPNKNLAGWLDHLLLKGHMWKETWDPEGVLSTLPSIGTGLLGALTGTWIKKEKDEKEKVAWMFVAGALLVALGNWWDYFFPINKSLWTSSYVVYAGGMALISLATTYWLIDVKKLGLKWIKPFQAFGLNPMAAYVLSGLVVRLMLTIKVDGVAFKTFIYQNIYASWLAPTEASFAYSISYIVLMYLPVWYLYKKNIVIKV
ncbi:acyltransferase family protein [Algivirga pacifica]|uniref:DUF5009 domain-containing protein n=1 Tax=Algivirga pacifica TaxID=1162670 RepID=A0ABP9DLC8_9BACT